MQFSKKSNYLNLLILTNNQLIFKKPKSQITSPAAIKPKLTVKSIELPLKSTSTKSVKEKRILLRKVFDSRAITKKSQKNAQNLQIIGKSESQEPSRCPSVHHRLKSISRQSLTKLPISVQTQVSIKSSNSNVPLSIYTKRPRRTVVQVIASQIPSQDISEIEDNEESLVIQSRYF